MFNIKTKIGNDVLNFGTFKDLYLEMKYTNTSEVIAECTYCFEPVGNLKITLSELEALADKNLLDNETNEIIKKFSEKKEKEIITGYNSDNEEFTCSEVCYKRTQEENHAVHYCCRFCDRVDNCSDICSFMEYPEERDYEDFCEFEWVVTRCYNCDRIIELGESSRSMRLCNDCGQSKDIELCEDCWDADVKY